MSRWCLLPASPKGQTPTFCALGCLFKVKCAFRRFQRLVPPPGGNHTADSALSLLISRLPLSPTRWQMKRAQLINSTRGMFLSREGLRASQLAGQTRKPRRQAVPTAPLLFIGCSGHLERTLRGCRHRQRTDCPGPCRGKATGERTKEGARESEQQRPSRCPTEALSRVRSEQSSSLRSIQPAGSPSPHP